jgi:hypothetical protein
MFVASKQLTSNYTCWLFTILEKVEQEITISSNPYQERVLGFMSERLLNVFVDHHQLKVKYVPVHFVAEKNKSKSVVMQQLMEINNHIIFWFRRRLSRK